MEERDPFDVYSSRQVQEHLKELHEISIKRLPAEQCKQVAKI